MSIPENTSSLIQLNFSITRTDNSTSSSSSMCFIDLRISSMTFSLLSLWNIQSRFVSSIEIDCPYSYISLCVFFDFSSSFVSLLFPCVASFCLATSRSFKEKRASGFSFFSSSRLNFSTPLLSLSSIML